MSLLSLRGLSKSFGGLVAVAHVSLELEADAVIGLIGPNGAGKTTLFNLITGNQRPDSGGIFFDGRDITGLPTHAVVRLGIARTFQNIRLFQSMSLLENVLAGRHCRLRAGLAASLLRPPFQRREERQAVRRARDELAFVGLEEQRDKPAGGLSHGSQRLLEIARALATDPRFLILDEPAGGMNGQETAALMELIAAIRSRGVSVLLIEHDMNLVMKVCRRIVVLEYGVVIAQGAPEHIKRDPAVIEAYLGSGE
ncbi:MAG: ABC transporter ATP-binding protein [Desulfovibrio sp.]|jgi:branched-chain amino acid transport system ATP-binding protein|nr:ABC transporter ATP-binding protein [Desulfovibrio sp.]